MGNLRHYIDGIKNGNEFFTVDKKLRFINVACAFYHLLLAVIFYFTDTPVLMLYNVASFFYFFILVLNCLKKGDYSKSVILSLSEVVICSFFSTVCVGLDTGFSSYDIAIISVSFYLTFVVSSLNRMSLVALFLSLSAIGCYIFNYVVSIFFPPLFPIQNQTLVHILYIMNHLFSFAMIIIYSYLLVWEIILMNNKLAKKNSELNELATLDPLTRLYNRRSMNDFLEESMTQLKLRGKRFSLVLGDIDDFKKVNDTYGHDAGDIILKNVANIIKANIGNDDYVCRWGGEEILILVSSSIENASLVAERIRKAIEDETVIYDKQQISITMTFGVSESIPGYRIEHLIQQADDKLYEGKRAGKNRVIT